VKKKRPKVVDRQVIGFNVLTGRAPPCAWLIYRVSWNDGTTTYERGYSITTMPGSYHLNGTKKQRADARKNLREDLFEVLHAIATLLVPVERACLAIDDKTWRLS
jgi:hypothetical protein